MIDLTTGSITPEGLPTLSPFMSREAFLGIFPETAIRYAHTPEKGSCHYFLSPCNLYGERCILSLCFDREKGLTDIRFSVAVNAEEGPVEQNGVERPVPKTWKPQEESAVKTANDAFLLAHCGLTKKDRNRAGTLEKETAFGSILSFYDAKGCSSDIVLRFKPQTEEVR